MAKRTEYLDLPECPNCGHVVEDIFDIFVGASEVEEVDCPNCEKPLTIVEHRSYSYSTWVREIQDG